MSKSTQLIGRALTGLAVAVAASILAAPGNAATRSAAPASSCAKVVSENSCYRWSHRSDPATSSRTNAARASTGCAQVVSENSCYRWAHNGGSVAAQPLPGARTTSLVSEPARASAPVRIGGGFHWGDAGVGAAGGAGLVLLALGLATLGGRRLKLRAVS
jgi:hypothetical protein